MKKKFKQLIDRLRMLKSRLFMTKDEKILCQVGALTIMELSKNRTFRRKVEAMDYGNKLKRVINY